MFSNQDTDWAISAKGNNWRRINGVVIVVGGKKSGGFWARAGDDFVKGTFLTEMAAKIAATNGVNSDDEDKWWEAL